MLLTIAIPTHNRVSCLRLLVDSLLAQIAQAERRGDRVAILIADNASTDGTGEYLESLAASRFVTIHRHAHNRGAAANVVHCFRHASSRYVWIIGDDDLPLPGAVDAVLRHLACAAPDLFLLAAKWVPENLEAAARACGKPGRAKRVDRIDLSLKASVMTTFISSWVVNREAYLHHYGDAGIDRFGDTLFPQLAGIRPDALGRPVSFGGRPVAARESRQQRQLCGVRHVQPSIQPDRRSELRGGRLAAGLSPAEHPVELHPGPRVVGADRACGAFRAVRRGGGGKSAVVGLRWKPVLCAHRSADDHAPRGRREMVLGARAHPEAGARLLDLRVRLDAPTIGHEIGRRLTESFRNGR